jgi:kynureninase
MSTHTRAPLVDCWLDAAMKADNKWGTIFGTLLPRLQRQIASVLALPEGKDNTIAFASNTQELFMRILSGIGDGTCSEPLVILTTDSEFHSFTRQACRLEEDKLVTRIIVPSAPFETFVDRFIAAIEANADALHMVFFSQAFFNSGHTLSQAELERVVASVPRDEVFVVVDAYHGFCAVQTDLSALHTRVFYMAGGYKYAMSGEGCCFLVVPDGYAPRPRNTGWFASFDALADAKTDRVQYSDNGSRFLGSTMDNSALYRMSEVLGWMETRGISVEKVHARVLAMQQLFLDEIEALETRSGGTCILPPLLNADPSHRGRFLTFVVENAAALCEAFAARELPGVLTDCREDKWRIGFALYHDKEDVLECARRFWCVVRACAPRRE